MNNLCKVAIAGADGKMGQMLINQALKNKQVQLVSALVLSDSKLVGKSVCGYPNIDCEVVYQTDINTAVAKSDVLIDFTRPDGTMEFLEFCLLHRKALVIGTTGFSDAQKEKINTAAKKIPIVFSSNMAPGVNVLFYLAEIASGLLANYDAEIYELHHKHKIDAPSGTALTLGEQILKGRKNYRPLKEMAVMDRTGYTGSRTEGSIGFAVGRGGDIVGEHTVSFLGEGEKLEIRHTSTQRVHYANGAISSGIYLKNKPPGLYTMAQVLGLNI